MTTIEWISETSARNTSRSETVDDWHCLCNHTSRSPQLRCSTTPTKTSILDCWKTFLMPTKPSRVAVSNQPLHELRQISCSTTLSSNHECSNFYEPISTSWALLIIQASWSINFNFQYLIEVYFYGEIRIEATFTKALTNWRGVCARVKCSITEYPFADFHWIFNALMWWNTSPIDSSSSLH